MNSKQLANVLTKILGLSLIAHGISGLINGIIAWYEFTSANHIRLFSDVIGNSRYWIIVLLDLVPFAIGIFLIIRSRWITEIIFKDEVE
jgi:multisubunit Na+/H+ antiporter MnhC subunit